MQVKNSFHKDLYKIYKPHGPISESVAGHVSASDNLDTFSRFSEGSIFNCKLLLKEIITETFNVLKFGKAYKTRRNFLRNPFQRNAVTNKNIHMFNIAEI